MRHGRFEQAADAFEDPVWRGVALMQAGRFAEAAQAFAGSDTSKASYDQGNALVMLGQYSDAITQYDHALALQPGWADATANRTLAQMRADRLAKLQGQQVDDEKAAADELYRREHTRDDLTATGGTVGASMTDEAVRALWLRRVQTRPADFLRARFAYQLEQPRSNAGQTP